MTPITIIGGGLAGLSLGIALRRREIPVCIHEAGSYPRHKVCGEFFAGINDSTLIRLGISKHFTDALLHRETAWFWQDHLVRRQTLPCPALGLSRYTLEHRLAQDFVDSGGDLQTGSRVLNPEINEGLAWTTGRQRKKTNWIGLKAHATNMATTSGLEIHLGDYGYAGASAVENGRVNICGLFRNRPEITTKKWDLLPAYLEACGMHSLSRRVTQSEIDPKSIKGVISIDFTHRHPSPGKLMLGDHFAAIPPFTGNGMSMALEASAMAVDNLVAYSKDEDTWSSTVNSVNTKLRNRFRRRLWLARRIHPLIFQPGLQRILIVLNNCRLLPFNLLFRLLH